MMSNTNNKGTYVVLTGIGSYMNIFEPRAFGSNEPKYSLCLLINKNDKKQLDRLNKAIEAAKEIAREKVWHGKIPPEARLSLPIHDGDIDRETDEYKGKYYINVSNKMKPGVVDQSVNPILDTEQIYSGCIVNVSMNLFGYNQNGNVGISASLQNVQLVADGERLAGKKPASADFSAVTEDDLAEIDQYLKGAELPDYFN